MNARFNRIGLRYFAERWARVGPIAVSWFGRSPKWLIAAVVVGSGAGMLLPLARSNSAEPVTSDVASVKLVPENGAAAVLPASQGEAPAMAELDRLKISSQTWRRGGLGSKALVTFTLRNDNDYAVRDMEIVCAFVRRDGSHLTDRSRVLGDTVDMKSRKTFARIPVGFVNVNADQAKCSLVAARRA